MAGILIVEDERTFREVLRISLLRRKYTVYEAADGKEAIAHFKPALIDLVITDLIMPEEEGLNVIIKLREIKPSVKIIAISGGGIAGPGSYLEVASALGADAIFSKPFPINKLIATIEDLLKVEQEG
jgi:CheY-like chemotaxis protein